MKKCLIFKPIKVSAAIDDPGRDSYEEEELSSIPKQSDDENSEEDISEVIKNQAFSNRSEQP